MIALTADDSSSLWFLGSGCMQSRGCVEGESKGNRKGSKKQGKGISDGKARANVAEQRVRAAPGCVWLRNEFGHSVLPDIGAELKAEAIQNRK